MEHLAKVIARSRGLILLPALWEIYSAAHRVLVMNGPRATGAVADCVGQTLR